MRLTGLTNFWRAVALTAIALTPRLGDANDTGCGGAAMSSGTHTVTHRGLTRTFKLFVPDRYDGRTPSRLVVIFHGWGGDENEFLGDPAVVEAANAHGYLLVAPRGIGAGPPDDRKNSWTFRGSASGQAGKDKAAICDVATTPNYTYPSCHSRTARNTCSWTQCQDDDVDFVVSLVRHLTSTLCVDPQHVFAAGGSNGGMLTWDLGQNPRTAPLFRAIAPLIGLPHRGNLQGPGKSARLPVILITGTEDTTVPPGAWEDDDATTSSNGDDRFHYTGATAISRVWARAAGCDTSRPALPVNVGVAAADCRSYCPANQSEWPTVLDCRARMGHDYGLPWSWKLMLDFFDRF